MKVKYVFSNETVEIEVSDDWGELLVNMDKEEKNMNRRETRRHFHLEACDYEGEDFAVEDENLNAIFAGPSDAERLIRAIDKLSFKQAELIRAIYFEGVSVNEYAAREGVTHSAISHRLDTAKRKLKRLMETE